MAPLPRFDGSVDVKRLCVTFSLEVAYGSLSTHWAHL